MSFITRINQLFSAPEPTGRISISFQQSALSYCHLDDQNIDCGERAVNNDQYKTTFAQLAEDNILQGQCYLVLSSKQNQIVQIDKPQVPAQEIAQAVKWQVKDLVTIAPEDMVIDYFDDAKVTSGPEKIHVVCADKNELMAYIADLDEYPLTIKAITTEEFAFASLFPIQDEARLMVCQQPNEDMLILIVKQGVLFFQRRLRGMDKIALKTEDELNMGIIDSLSLEIQRSTDYFERQLKQPPIRSIDVLVPMKNEAFLARRLAENTDIPVNLFTMPDGFSEQRAFAASVGATMLHHMEDSP